MCTVRSVELEWCLVLRSDCLLYPQPGRQATGETQTRIEHKQVTKHRVWETTRIRVRWPTRKSYTPHGEQQQKRQVCFRKRDCIGINLHALECDGMSCFSPRTCCQCGAILSCCRIVRNETFHQFPQSLFERILFWKGDSFFFCWSLLVFMCTYPVYLFFGNESERDARWIVWMGGDDGARGRGKSLFHFSNTCAARERGRKFSIFNARTEANN